MDKHGDRKRAESGSNIFRRLICREIADDSFSDKDKVPCNTPRRSLESRVARSSDQMASNSVTNGTSLMGSGEYVRDPGSILSLQPWIFKRENSQRNEGNTNPNGNFSDNCVHEMNGFTDASIVEDSPRSVSLGYSSGKGRNSLRSRRSGRNTTKLLTSMENSLIPQLYNENFEIEEYVFSSFSSPSAVAARPFIVTDGNKIISKSGYEPSVVPINFGLREDGRGDSLRVKEPVFGFSPLPELRKTKRKSRERQKVLELSSSHRLSKHSHSQDSFDGTLLFSLGISIGILFSALSNKKEVEKLNTLLKRTENLVQDLQEELEMKESLVVEELPREACGSQRDEHEKQRLPEVESMSKIEAELQAELERLELNMTVNNLERRLSDLDEVDHELVGDVLHGELRADKLFNQTDITSRGEKDRDSKGSSTGGVHETNYSVCPKELSLRLHEVIQLRQEERIKELEESLSQNLKQLQLMEAEKVLSDRTFSNSDMGSSSNWESPTLIRRDSDSIQPFCLNLAGDALDAYNEAYGEFMRMADAEGNLPTDSANIREEYGNELNHSDRSLIWGLEGGQKESAIMPPWEEVLKSRVLNDTDESDGDKEEEYEDDESKLLIQQIVERARDGSPVLLHAQRILFSADE